MLARLEDENAENGLPEEEEEEEGEEELAERIQGKERARKGEKQTVMEMLASRVRRFNPSSGLNTCLTRVKHVLG